MFAFKAKTEASLRKLIDAKFLIEGQNKDKAVLSSHPGMPGTGDGNTLPK